MLLLLLLVRKLGMMMMRMMLLLWLKVLRMKILTVTLHRVVVVVVDDVVYAVVSHRRRRYICAVNGATAGAPGSVCPPWTPRPSAAAAWRARASRTAGTPAASASDDPPLRTEGFKGVGVFCFHSKHRVWMNEGQKCFHLDHM